MDFKVTLSEVNEWVSSTEAATKSHRRRLEGLEKWHDKKASQYSYGSQERKLLYNTMIQIRIWTLHHKMDWNNLFTTDSISYYQSEYLLSICNSPWDLSRLTPLPLLFTIIIEPLAARIRQSPLISPINMFGSKHYLYADNILLYISQPHASIPPLLILINKFGSLSRFSVNWEKSEVTPVSTAVHKAYLQSIPF